MTLYDEQRARLRRNPHTWLVTGAAGFIGSHLVEALLRLKQTVVGLDNLSTGHRHNLEQVREAVGEQRWKRFRFIEGDIRSLETCHEACRAVDFVLHQAALGSVPRSMEDPLTAHAVNVTPQHAACRPRRGRGAHGVCGVECGLRRPISSAQD